MVAEGLQIRIAAAVQVGVIFNMVKLWKIWAKALGEKSGYEADKVALVRTLIVGCYVVTNLFIIAGVIRHW